MLACEEAFNLEQHCRRPGWCPGQSLRLADGNLWHLPTIKPSWLGSDSRLVNDLRDAAVIAQSSASPSSSDAQNRDDLCEFHGLLAVIAIRLLQSNYVLPDCTWMALFSGNSLVETFQMTLTLAHALEDHCQTPPLSRVENRSDGTLLADL